MEMNNRSCEPALATLVVWLVSCMREDESALLQGRCAKLASCVLPGPAALPLSHCGALAGVTVQETNNPQNLPILLFLWWTAFVFVLARPAPNAACCPKVFARFCIGVFCLQETECFWQVAFSVILTARHAA